MQTTAPSARAQYQAVRQAISRPSADGGYGWEEISADALIAKLLVAGIPARPLTAEENNTRPAHRRNQAGLTQPVAVMVAGRLLYCRRFSRIDTVPV